MARLTRLVLILAIGTIAGWPVAPRAIGAASREKEIPPAIVEEHGHLTVLRLRGTSYEMGYQHGVAQRAVIRRWVNEQVYNQTILGDKQPHSILLTHAHQLGRALPNDIRHELRGIADGAGLSFEDILILNLVLNRLPSQPLPLPPALSALPILNLQALALAAQPPATSQGNASDSILLGYRLNAPDQATRLRRHLLAIVYQPSNGQTYATLTWSGQVGAWCGLNEAGLAICATPARGDHADNPEFPPAILTRHLLAHATDGEQALRQAIQHDYVATFRLLIADGQRQSATAIAFSRHRYEMMSAAESDQGVLILAPNPSSVASLLSQNLGWLDRDKALALLANRESFGGGSPDICSEATLFSALFVPGRGELWIGLDLWPASCRRYLRLNVTP